MPRPCILALVVAVLSIRPVRAGNITLTVHGDVPAATNGAMLRCP
jgi:hypothetical protein